MPDIPHPRSGEAHIRYRKWDGALHWHFDAVVVDTDSYGLWVTVPPGGVYRRGDEPPRTDPHGFVVLVTDDWWTAYFNAVPRGDLGHLIYVDINTPPTRGSDVIELIDLDLDVVAGMDRRARVIDEDEFEEHRVAFEYPPDVVDRARVTAARVAADIDGGGEPFASVGPGRVAATLGWAHGSVVAGHGVASGAAGDPRFPLGTIAEQAPAFVEAGLPAGDWYRGTINVAIPWELVPRRPRVSIEGLRWKTGYPAETFSFFEARVAVDGTVHGAYVYRPDPITKPEFAQPHGVIELVAPQIAGIAPGVPVSVWVDPEQAGFDVA